MKKWMIMVVLAAMLLALTACAQPQMQNSTDPTDPIEEPTEAPTLPDYEPEEPTIKDGFYQITEPAHLTYLAQHPDKDYALAEDIGCSKDALMEIYQKKHDDRGGFAERILLISNDG